MNERSKFSQKHTTGFAFIDDHRVYAPDTELFGRPNDSPQTTVVFHKWTAHRCAFRPNQ